MDITYKYDDDTDDDISNNPNYVYPKNKIIIFLGLGLILLLGYISVKYILGEPNSNSPFLILVFFGAIVFLLFGFYFASTSMGKQKIFLFFLGSFGIGIILLVVYVNLQFDIFLDLGILCVVLGFFFLINGILMLFQKK